MHSHDVRPPVSEVDYQNEVSGYGFEGFEGDANDHWVLEIDQFESAYGGKHAKTHLEALRTRFRLRHMLTGCYLFSHKVKLPEWGFEQQEVTCNKNPSRENALWYIETNEHKMRESRLTVRSLPCLTRDRAETCWTRIVSRPQFPSTHARSTTVVRRSSPSLPNSKPSCGRRTRA